MGGAGGIIVHRCVNSLYSLDSLAALMDRQILRVFFYSSRVKISQKLWSRSRMGDGQDKNISCRYRIRISIDHFLLSLLFLHHTPATRDGCQRP